MLRQLNRENPDTPGRSVDQHFLPGLDLPFPQEMQRRHPAKQDRRGLLKRHVHRFDLDQAILGHAHVLGVGAVLEPPRPEYLVALGEPGRGLARRLDRSRELHPQDVDLLWPPKAVHDSYEEGWLGLSEPPVRRGNRRRMDANQDFVVPGNWLFDVLDLDNVRRTVSGIDGRFHPCISLTRAASTVLPARSAILPGIGKAWPGSTSDLWAGSPGISARRAATVERTGRAHPCGTPCTRIPRKAGRSRSAVSAAAWRPEIPLRAH